MCSAPVQRDRGKVVSVVVERRLRWIAPTLLVATGAVTVLAFLAAQNYTARFATLVIVASVLYLGMVFAERRYGGMTIGRVVVVAAATYVVMVVFEPRTSH